VKNIKTSNHCVRDYAEVVNKKQIAVIVKTEEGQTTLFYRKRDE
jgi:hypothetical protein